MRGGGSVIPTLVCLALPDPIRVPMDVSQISVSDLRCLGSEGAYSNCSI
jgi:hypothetical protein